MTKIFANCHKLTKLITIKFWSDDSQKLVSQITTFFLGKDSIINYYFGIKNFSILIEQLIPRIKCNNLIKFIELIL